MIGKTNIMGLFGSCFRYLNLIFSVFSKTKRNWKPNVLSSLFLRTKNSFQKYKPNRPINVGGEAEITGGRGSCRTIPCTD